MAKEVSFEEKLWKSAIKLRGGVETAEYKHVVLSLIFLKYVNDRFDKQLNKITEEFGEEYIDIPEFYIKDNAFYIPETSRWAYIMENAKQSDIAIKIDTALHDIELNNEGLKGALPNNYYSRLEIDHTKLASLLDVINTIKIKDDEEDSIGRIYEYFLGQFAGKEGQGKGEFYTPKSVVKLIAELIEPYDGKIYDPCCGSGGMFVQSMEFIKQHEGNSKNVSIYGQEAIATTRKLAMMNLAIRGISYNLGEKNADTFLNDLHKDLKADYIMANPPFNLDSWREENQLINDYRWSGYEVPPVGNANYAWILHMVSKLSENGVAGFILSNGALNSSGVEYNIRKKLIENGLIESIMVLPMKLFYSTNISVTLWVINKNKVETSIKKNDELKTYRNRKDEVIFFDLRNMGSPYNKKYVELTDDDRKKVVETFHRWQLDISDYEDVPEFCYSASLDEIKENDYDLSPSQYIEFINKDETMDYDSEMTRLSRELEELLKEESNSTDILIKLMKELDYEIRL